MIRIITVPAEQHCTPAVRRHIFTAQPPSLCCHPFESARTSVNVDWHAGPFDRWIFRSQRGTLSEEVQISAHPRVGNHAWHLDERRALATWLTATLTRGDGCATPAARRHKDHRRACPRSTRRERRGHTVRISAHLGARLRPPRPRHRAKQCNWLISSRLAVRRYRCRLCALATLHHEGGYFIIHFRRMKMFSIKVRTVSQLRPQREI